jgi:hypothetical protein
MKPQAIYLSIFLLLISCNSENKKREGIVKEYVEFANIGEISRIDSMLSSEFKLLTDSSITSKKEYLSYLEKPIANTKVKLNNIDVFDGVFKTKEIITDDIITYLDLEPIVRIREYHFNEKDQITSIYNISQTVPKDYIKIQKDFLIWAYKEYPDFVTTMIERARNGENIDEERRFLLAKLKEKGVQVLNRITDKTEIINNINTIKSSDDRSNTPDNDFMNSLVVTYFGMNAFPFGEYTVREFVNAIKSSVFSNGKRPIIKKWTKKDNIYTLLVDYDGENVRFVFKHLLNQDGNASTMSGIINEEEIDGVEMYQLVPTLIKNE